MNQFPFTKSEVITNLINFSQDELHNYTSNRNFDYGPPHHNVSKISPYLRRRFISENEVLGIVLKDHKINNIEKFIEEIFWRTYWKGWLESHPWIYDEYKAYDEDQSIPKKTGIKCFEHWKEELLDTGYLHNHSRMWFASIWIFTLGYSWQSGANFFKKNLLDYCPASNTLGWRWVAGLQTIGKPYMARADNIKFFTNGRFYPQNELKENYILNNQNFTNGKPKDFIKSDGKKLIKYENLGIILNNNDLSLHLLLKEKEAKSQLFQDQLMSQKELVGLKQRNDEQNRLIELKKEKIFKDSIEANKLMNVALKESKRIPQNTSSLRLPLHPSSLPPVTTTCWFK